MLENQLLANFRHQKTILNYCVTSVERAPTAQELTTKKGERIVLGEKPSVSSHDFEKAFPLSFDGNQYGTLTLIKENTPTDKVAIIDWRWITGIALALTGIFITIRIFISRQVIAPITGLVRVYRTIFVG